MRGSSLVVALVVVGCGASKSAPEAKPPVASEAPVAKSAAPEELPPDVEAMLGGGPCASVFRAPLEAHYLREAEGKPNEKPPLIIAPNEKLCLIGRADGSVEIASTPVAEAQQAERLISIELAQASIGTVLVVRNHFSRPFRYRALFKAPGAHPVPTKVCDAPPNLAGLEHWPDPVEAMVVGDFQFLDPGTPMGCQ